MSDPSARSELLPLVGQRASVEIAALVIPPVVLAAVPDGASAAPVWAWALLYWLASIGVVFTRRRFRQDLRALSPPVFEARWTRPLETTALAFGLMWGLLPWTAVGIATFEFSLFIYLVLVGSTASTVSFAAADLRVLGRFLLPAWTLATLAAPFAFPDDWLSVTPLCMLFPWLVWRHGRTANGFLQQQSQLKRQSEALAQAHQEARDAAAAASRDKSLFLATASHDLRQPLYALTLTAQAALERNRDAALGPLLVDISQAASHVNELLNSLLDVSALDGRGADLTLQPLALAPLLSELHERFLPEARARGLAWRIRGPEQAAWVMAEPILLRRALSNLLHNALRYTPQGGVLLAVRRRDPGWAIEVWDTGVGVPETQRDRLFAQFNRGDDADKVARDGQGLGLSVVRDCVRRLGATIDWFSTPGRGSCFRITLARATTPTVVVTRDTAIGPTFDRMDGRVLVIDDDLGVIRGLQHLLGGWGLDCRVAADAAQAHAALDAGFEPDVIMSDLRLRHDASGYALMLALQARQPHARALVVTGELDLPDLHRAESEGYLVLRKPVQPLPLHAVLRSLLVRRAPQVRIQPARDDESCPS